MRFLSQIPALAIERHNNDSRQAYEHSMMMPKQYSLVLLDLLLKLCQGWVIPSAVCVAGALSLQEVLVAADSAATA
jgi:hypothetical protein